DPARRCSSGCLPAKETTLAEHKRGRPPWSPSSMACPPAGINSRTHSVQSGFLPQRRPQAAELRVRCGKTACLGSRPNLSREQEVGGHRPLALYLDGPPPTQLVAVA